MAHTVDSISIRGLRKAHLRQLATYIRERDREGWYYGPREQFERRHADLLKLADRIEAIANDEDARLPNAEAHGRRSRTVQPLVGNSDRPLSGRTTQTAIFRSNRRDAFTR